MCLFIESIRIENGLVCNLDYHVDRFNRTRAAFWGDIARINLSEFISPPELSGIQKCRIVYGKRVEEITYASYQVRGVSSLRLIADDLIDYTYKKADRKDLNSLFSQRGTADDILVIKNGYLTDTSIANIALYQRNTWFTPAHPLLKGIRRAELLEKRLIIEKDIPLSQIKDYSYIMLFNAMIDWGQIIIPINEQCLIL